MLRTTCDWVTIVILAIGNRQRSVRVSRVNHAGLAHPTLKIDATKCFCWSRDRVLERMADG